MSELHRRLMQGLPERRPPVRGGFATDARSLRSWVASLPMANFSATAKMLLEGMRSLNALRIDAGERLDALEILRRPVAQLAELTDKQIIGASFPLPAQKAELGLLAQDFQREIALGYQSALYDLCAPSGAVPFLKGKQVALAATRALHHGGERLAKAYLLYRTPPIGAWQSLHDVYRFIADARLDDRTFDDPLIVASITPRLAYCHALLLALANPYRFTQREGHEVFALTRTLAPYCELRQGSARAGTLAVDTSADRGPGYLPEERTAGQEGLLSLDVSALIAFIESQVTMLPPGARLATFRLRGGPGVQVDIDLVRRLVNAWTNTGERGHQRLGGGHQLETVIGLHDLHFVLAGNEDFEGFLRRVRGMSISLSERDRVASWAAGAEQTRANRLKAHVLDQSLGGYRLLWERGANGEAVKAKVGELVGLALTGDEIGRDWMVGVIRWIRIDDDGRVDAGVELLARRALAVGVRNFDENNNPRAAMRGVLLWPQRRGEHADYSSLLAPGMLEKAPPEVELTLPVDPHRWPSRVRTERVRGLGLLDSTGAYLQFALPPLGGEAAATTTVDEAVVATSEGG